MLGSIIWLLVIIAVMAQFWVLRGISEGAQRFLHNYCQQHQLQLLSMARAKTRPALHKGKLIWKNEFQFEFSGNGEDASQGTMTMMGYKVLSVETPAYRI